MKKKRTFCEQIPTAESVKRFKKDLDNHKFLHETMDNGRCVVIPKT